MRKRENGFWRLLLGALTAMICFLSMTGEAEAGSFRDNPYIVYAPDGMAWTVPERLPAAEDAGNAVAPMCWYRNGDTVVTGVKGAEKKAGEGEHEYDYDRKGLVPVEKWQVVYATAKCIHPNYEFFHGLKYSGSWCRSSYYSGWNGFCADCHRQIDSGNVYMSRSKIGILGELDLNLDYYYNCPTCGHLEQGRSIRHTCKEVSANRYQVIYEPNAGDAEGYMQPSFHMYNDAEVYEGEPVTPVKTLSLNTFFRVGYQFVGWNTLADGSGSCYEDGQEIRNLSKEEYDRKSGKGIVRLYAQWKKITGKLVIDPGTGKYKGKAGCSEEQIKYGEKYIASSGNVTPPKGWKVSFEANGGEGVEPLQGSCRFVSWRMEQPAKGVLQGDVYHFWGMDGEQDRITAEYVQEGILLPLTEKKGYSFGGWYQDTGCTILAGKAGDRYVPSGNTVLYACWVELVLQAELNLSANQRKGAVDLKWEQKDGTEKSYLLFQRREETEFERIYSVSEEMTGILVDEAVFLEAETAYEIPLTGFYCLEAYGAQGQNFGENSGGLGGGAKGIFYLEAGDKLTIQTGMQNGYYGGETVFQNENRGGIASEYGNGGGKSRIASERAGLLMMAGGGGGASAGIGGGNGGLDNGLWMDGNGRGQDGQAGGGAGYVGGLAGEYRIHEHQSECYHVHNGDPLTGGECYRKEKVQKNCSVIIHNPTRDPRRLNDCMPCLVAGRNGYNSMFLYSWTIEHKGCGQGKVYGTNCWWQCSVCGQMGYISGSGPDRPTAQDHLYEADEFFLECEKEYDCEDYSRIVSPAYGGSSFINQEEAISYEYLPGVQNGNGLVRVVPINVGFQEKMELNGVPAPDLDAPEEIGRETIKIAADDENVQVQFEKPEDNGTIYFHKVQSFPLVSEAMLSESNITRTVVKTGVAGYYYLMDNKKNTAVSKKNAFNANNLVMEEKIVITKMGKERYLHIAAVDYAGNVSKSISIDLSEEKRRLTGKLHTEQMEISSVVNGQDYKSVYVGAEGNIYVRADGETPFCIIAEGMLEGSQDAEHWIDRVEYRYGVNNSGAEGIYTAVLPNGQEILAGEFLRSFSGNGILQTAMYGRAERSADKMKIEMEQTFTLDPRYDGDCIWVSPALGALYGEKSIWSDEEEDSGHGIKIIGDAQAPWILGAENLERLQLIDRQNSTLHLKLEAKDDLSGVKDFYVTLCNLDNYGEMTFRQDGNGQIVIDMTEEIPLFCGDLKLTVYAEDQVGNKCIQEYGATEFGLKARIYRILSPHTAKFKKGESGLLEVTAWGYADRLEIDLPDAFSPTNDFLHKTYEYEIPTEKIVEELEFMVPLSVEDDKEYTITVRAYKGERELEQYPVLCTMRVNGSVLGEIHTRLR